MKIGFVVDDTLDKPDGVQQYVLALGRWFASQGHEVHYLAGESRRTDIPNIHSMSRNISVRFNGNRLAIPLPTPKRVIQRLLDQEDFDVLHVQTPHSPFMAQRVVCAASTQTAIIATFHILLHNSLAARLNSVLGRVLRPSLRRMDAIVAVSEAAKIFADKSFKITTSVIPNTIDLQPFFGSRPMDTYADMRTIVYLNRLEPRKGCTYLLQAINELVHVLHEPTPFRVVICGKGSQAEGLRRFVSEHGLESWVTFTGFVTEADKCRYLASADIAVYPSIGGESFGIVLLEAMAASPGVVLAGNNPGYASVMSEFPDQLFDPKDTNKLARMISGWLRDDKGRAQRATTQRTYTERFDVPIIGARLLEVYEAALRERRSHVIM